MTDECGDRPCVAEDDYYHSKQGGFTWAGRTNRKGVMSLLTVLLIVLVVVLILGAGRRWY